VAGCRLGVSARKKVGKACLAGMSGPQHHTNDKGKKRSTNVIDHADPQPKMAEI